MRRMYNEYLSVDSDFIPVFSVNSDKRYPNKWKSFYPHDSFKTIIAQLVDTLEKRNISKDLPMWMYGAYGTGKTFASFVIKHILEDDLTDIEAYCKANDMLSLYSRIEGVRSKGKMLVVHRSSSASIVGNNKLFNCINESIRMSLRRNRYSYMGGKSQYDIILDTLKDPAASFNFANAFQKYNHKFEGYTEPSSVIRDLEELGSEGTIDLLETIVEVAELEHYFWSTEPDDVIAWIKDIINGNNLYAVVFIWDEFTEYFKNNQNNITGLQELAHASSEISFYLFLITHSGTQIINDQSAKKIIEARFKIRPIDMAETTAFMLMGQAIKRELDLESEWEKIADDLWGRIEFVTNKTIIQYARDITQSELKSLLPIHPYAAYLLKLISTEISSNQRTMFQFLTDDFKDGDIERKNFRWFISEHNSEMGGWSYLTADYIWDYFFTDNNVDLSDVFRSAIAQYDNYAHLFKDDDDKLKVLKVALLLSAIQQTAGTGRSQGQSVLLRATSSNISTAFAGTPIQTFVPNIMAEFVSKSIFSSVQDGNDTLYVPPAGNIDQERFDKMLEDNRRILTFEKILSEASNGIAEQVLPDGYLNYRYKAYLVSASPSSMKSVLEQTKDLDVNILPLFYVYALNETEQVKSGTLIEKLLSDLGRNAVAVNFSSTPFTDNAFEKYLRSKTEERYYGEGSSQAKIAKQNAATLIREWKYKLNVTSVDVYPSTEGQIGKVQGGVNLRKKLREFNALWFGCGLEDIAVNDKLFASSGYKETVAQMAMGHIPIPNNYSYLNQISGQLIHDNIWTNTEYMTVLPNHVVSRMKKRITDIINAGFSNDNSMVAIVDIWNALKQPPFGLLNCTGSTFLLGFLLKEYATGRYYKYDGANTGTQSLNPNDLSDLIFAMVKENPKVKNQYILKQKPEHTDFCIISGNVFKISKDKQNSIQDISKNISVFLKNNYYPLWALKYFIQEEMDDHELCKAMINAISLYCELISPDKMTGRDAAKIAEDLYALYKQNSGLEAVLSETVNVENMKNGMSFYIALYKPELILLVKRIGINEQAILIALNKKLSDDATYLWNIGDTNHQIENLYAEYSLIDTVNGILTSMTISLDETIAAVDKKLNLIRIPFSLLTEERPDLLEIFKALFLIKNRSLSNILTITAQIKKDSEVYNTFFTNQFETFTSVLSKRLGQLSQEELMHLYEHVPANTLNITADEFIPIMVARLAEYRKSKKINQLFELWKNNTNSDSPAIWSKKNTISILCLFDDNGEQASEAFELLNKTRIPKTEGEIDKAITFLCVNVFPLINNLDKCSELFVSYFSGDYAYLIDNSDELKGEMYNVLGDNVYGWINNRKAVSACVERLAREKYCSTYRAKVVEKISKLTAAEAQKLLVELVEDEPLVGINILKM